MPKKVDDIDEEHKHFLDLFTGGTSASANKARSNSGKGDDLNDFMFNPPKDDFFGNDAAAAVGDDTADANNNK